ncbi:MAG TPA: tetratricopeptide repeat protein [Xanthobacteraceae bacterium]
MYSPQSLPPAPVAQLLLEATTHYQQGRLADAEAVCTRILQQAPDSPDAPHLLGLVQLKQGKADAALSFIDASLKIDPRSPNALASRGRALAALNRTSEALASFEASLALAPNDPDTLSNRGSMLLSLERPAEALEALDRAAALAPRHFGALINRGNALALLGRLDAALAQYDALVDAHPTRAELHFNRGNALAGLSRHAEAIAAFDRALASQPNYVRAHINRGAALQAINQHRDALASFANAVRMDRTNHDVRHNAALSLLTLGEYRPGFIQYEMRQSNMPPRRRSFGTAAWLGESAPTGQTLLLHAEQGFGDTVQFIRYAPLVAGLGARIVLEAPVELLSLLQQVDGIAEIVGEGGPLPAFDLHCPLPSLPLAMRTELATIPAQIPYLKASEERIAQWRARLAPVRAPRVALAWSGRATHLNDRNRSLALARLAPLFTLDEISFISIQHEMRAEDAGTLAGLPRITDVGKELHDFEDTAAVLALADLVISVDTSVAHLAGAIGRRTWILLPFSPDWRWMLERTDSPWYPTARLYRQPALGDWDGVVAGLRAGLKRLLDGGPGAPGAPTFAR